MGSLEDLGAKLGFHDHKKNCWRQIILAISHSWKEMFLKCSNNISDPIINEPYLIKKHQIYCLEN